MDNLKEIRWKQRFYNFEKAYLLLEKFIKIDDPDEIERAGGIQFFEMSFELAWKLLKDYLENELIILSSPREVIKTAFQMGIITEGHSWLDGLNDRNLTVHTYDEETALTILDNIRNSYFPLMQSLYQKLKKEI